jgi:hypothetical protein
MLPDEAIVKKYCLIPEGYETNRIDTSEGENPPPETGREVGLIKRTAFRYWHPWKGRYAEDYSF